MKAYLMYPDQDFHLSGELPWGSDTLIADLELKTLFSTMAQGDAFLFDVVRKGVMGSLHDPAQILFRQDVLRDCVANATTVRSLYGIAVEAIEIEKKSYYSIFTKYPAAILSGARSLMETFIAVLVKLRAVADQTSGRFHSEGFTRFFAMIQQELSDEYFKTLDEHLRELRFRNGTLISALLGKGNKGIQYVLRKPNEQDRNLLKRFFGKRPPSLTFHIADRDEAGANALSELEGRGINLAADAVSQSAEHVLSFFRMLRTELAFYIGCLNLLAVFDAKGQTYCYPEPAPLDERRHTFKELCDVCLALRLDGRVVPNDLDSNDAALVIITGANEGGKSTFLRSVGLAQMMMQAGMVVGAAAFRANVCVGQFTHYKREEDTSMTSGKFDEELVRMNEIADHVKPDSILFFNESFAATNEREGSEVARQIVSALLEEGVKVFFVTHMYQFAHGLYDTVKSGAVFLRAERREGGERTFRVSPGEPLETSYGEDLYARIFGEDTTDPTVGECVLEEAGNPSGDS
ncbi:MutS-related protein [Paraburkholderia terrae]|uniref:MutS-related protein n=1 Tax=Paraburkholderia terrae TaxID=311230 RepID=UPI00296B1460|nr:DNA mismatch repair protein MutS [Paraburkholderia terrae]MDW3660644.1 DNA mismatch repair protein MutS [Paraburkholderia terrae]